jgi:hypothetical protein
MFHLVDSTPEPRCGAVMWCDVMCRSVMLLCLAAAKVVAKAAICEPSVTG